MLSAILAGLGAGATYSLTMYAKKEGQEFDTGKFLTTVMIGGLAGVGMVLYGVPIETSYIYLMNVGLVPLIENVFKMLWRKGSNLKAFFGLD